MPVSYPINVRFRPSSSFATREEPPKNGHSLDQGEYTGKSYPPSLREVFDRRLSPGDLGPDRDRAVRCQVRSVHGWCQEEEVYTGQGR